MKKNLLKILFLVNDRSSFVFGDSNVARTGLSGIGFPSARIEQMIEIIPTMPLPFHCDYAVMTFSVSHINFLKKGRIEELVKLYKDMRNLLMSRFQYIIIIGARPGKYFNLQKIRNIMLTHIDPKSILLHCAFQCQMVLGKAQKFLQQEDWIPVCFYVY